MDKPLKQSRLSSNKLRFLFLFSIYFICSFCVFAQDVGAFSFRFKIGLIVEYGSHVNRLGIVASTASQFEATQFNAELRGYYNFKTFGPPQKGVETVWSLGIAQGFGQNFYAENPLVDSHFFNSGRQYALGYTFSKYDDKMETSQGTGSVFFAHRDFFLNFENDLFGNTHGRDRFRTGGVSLHYYYDRWLFTVKNIIWTGETRCKEKVSHTDTDYPSRYGYQDVTKCKYGNFSHGIAAINVRFMPEDWFGQNFYAALGLDHEKIRHFFQNKLVHDMYFVPDKINPSQNLHYPMLDVDGEPYLFLKDQILKKPRLYAQLSANGHWLY